MEKKIPEPVCGQEALDLLNCVTDSSFDQEKCLRFLQSLRECVLSKVWFYCSHDSSSSSRFNLFFSSVFVSLCGLQFSSNLSFKKNKNYFFNFEFGNGLKHI